MVKGVSFPTQNQSKYFLLRFSIFIKQASVYNLKMNEFDLMKLGKRWELFSILYLFDPVSVVCICRGMELCLGVWSIMWVEISTAAALPSVLCSSRSLCAPHRVTVSPCQTADRPTRISTMPTCQRPPSSQTAGTVAAAGPPGAWCPLWAPTSTSGVMESYSSGLTPRGERSHDHSDYHRKLNPENKHHKSLLAHFK